MISNFQFHLEYGISKKIIGQKIIGKITFREALPPYQFKPTSL